MARYNTRRPQANMHRALRPLLELRHSQEYFDGGLPVAEQASITAFDAEVALHALGGAQSVPRRVRFQLHQAVEEQLEMNLEQSEMGNHAG